MILFDETAVEIPADYLPRARPVRMEKLAKEIGGSLRAKNMVAVGAVSGVISFDTTPIEELVLRRYAHKQGVADANIAALRAGHDEGDDLTGSLAIADAVEVEADRVLMSGQPGDRRRRRRRRPDLLRRLPDHAGVRHPRMAVGQAAAGGRPHDPVRGRDRVPRSVLGASYTGAKAMTATSGPGLSLMTEMLGYAGTAEIPCVIVDAQRGGPSTGLPTKTEQSDLQHALYGGHGEAPRVVMAPITVEDCFWATIDAFNYSERFQVPVILLTDQGLATRMEVIHKPDTSRWSCGSGAPRRAGNGDYKRYAYTDDSVSPMGIPGEEGGQYVATGIEHDEYGHPGYTPEIHTGMQTKRWAKLTPLANGAARHEVYGDERPDDRGHRLRLHLRARPRGRRVLRERGPVGGRVLPARARALPGRAA